MLTVIAIICILIGLALPAIEKVREAAARIAAEKAGYASAEEWEKAKAVERVRAQQRENEQSAQRMEEANKVELNTRLSAFTKERVPELHAAINQIDRDWKDREVRCNELAVELKRLNRDPTSDPDLQRWRTAITEMKEHLVELRKQREEAYIAFKKFELAPSGKAEYERKLQMARKAAADSQDYHKKMQTRLESK